MACQSLSRIMQGCLRRTQWFCCMSFYKTIVQHCLKPLVRVIKTLVKVVHLMAHVIAKWASASEHHNTPDTRHAR